MFLPKFQESVIYKIEHFCSKQQYWPSHAKMCSVVCHFTNAISWFCFDMPFNHFSFEMSQVIRSFCF